MLYHVKAQPIRRELSKFRAMLNDGTITNQEPDGQEIRASMMRAVIAGDTVEWYETCYCNSPLKHERTTIYDKFFTDMEVKPVDSAHSLRGQRFWNHLEDLQTKETPRYSAKTAVLRPRIT